MNNTDKVEEYLRSSIKLLHSSAPDSAREMRKIVESEISKHHGKSATLKAKLSGKQMYQLIKEEEKAVGSNFKTRKPKPKPRNPVPRQTSKKVRIAPIREPMRNLCLNDKKQPPQEEKTSEDINASITTALLNELTCQICHEMESIPKDLLNECSSCHLLFHASCLGIKKATKKSAEDFLCNSCT